MLIHIAFKWTPWYEIQFSNIRDKGPQYLWNKVDYFLDTKYVLKLLSSTYCRYPDPQKPSKKLYMFYVPKNLTPNLVSYWPAVSTSPQRMMFHAWFFFRFGWGFGLVGFLLRRWSFCDGAKADKTSHGPWNAGILRNDVVSILTPRSLSVKIAVTGKTWKNATYR